MDIWWNIWSSIKWWFSSVSWLFSWEFFWVIIMLAIFWWIWFVIYLLISWKVALYNQMFNENFWLKLITWSFWSWKTKNVYQSAFLRRRNNPHWIIISNLKYDFVDIYFDDVEDFQTLMDYLVRYIRDTNDAKDLEENYEFPPIKIIIDEAHIYLFSRDFKAFTKNNLLVLTQVRKREISIDFITQELSQIDVFIRRLCPYITYFNSRPFGFRSQYLFYCKDNESLDINDENAFESIKHTILVPDNWVLKLNRSLKKYYQQRRLTKWVIWWKSVLTNSYEEFKWILLKQLENFRKPKLLKDPKFKKKFRSFNLWNKTDQEKKLEAQKRLIDYLLTKVDSNDIQNIEENIVSSEKSSSD